MELSSPAIIEVTPDERVAQGILRDAVVYAQNRTCDWNDYEIFKQRLAALDLMPEQYALACGALAKVMGV